MKNAVLYIARGIRIGKCGALELHSGVASVEQLVGHAENMNTAEDGNSREAAPLGGSGSMPPENF